nr:zinc finger, CCHC-type [Tanacetum cinerariifolium]
MSGQKLPALQGMSNTWVLDDLPLGYKWIFKRKLKVDGTIKKFKMNAKTSFLNGDLDGRFSMKDMEEADVILGLRIKHESNGIAISQSHYIKKVLKKFSYFDCTPVSTPMDTSEKLMPNNGQAVSQLEYSRVIGCLMNVMTCIRPDIAFAMGKLSRYTSNLGTQHWQAIQRVLKYLKKTIDYILTYTSYPSLLESYTDARWVSNTKDNSSTNGWVFLLGGGATSWALKKQTCITGSTIEYEFVALAAVVLLHWQKAYSQMYNEKSRHLGVRHSMIRELFTNEPMENLIFIKRWEKNIIVGSVLLENDHADFKQEKDMDDDIPVQSINNGDEDESPLLNIPLHVLESVMELCVGVEYLKFRSTCKLCHLAAPLIQCKNGKAVNQLETYSLLSPWLMVFNKHKGIFTFTDPMFGDNFSAPPTSPDCMVVASSRQSIFIHFVGEPSWDRVSLDFNGKDYQFFTLYGPESLDLYAMKANGELDIYKEMGEEYYCWERTVCPAPTSCCTSLRQSFLVRCEERFLQVILGEFGESVEPKFEGWRTRSTFQDCHRQKGIWCSIHFKHAGLILSQKQYAIELLARAHMTNCNPSRTPVDMDSKLGPEDISYAVQQICLYMYDPREPHLAALKRILGYIRGTLDFGFHVYSSTTISLVGYTDADWTGCPSTRRSTSAETAWLRNLLRELRSPLSAATLVYCDNVSTTYMSTNPVQH